MGQNVSVYIAVLSPIERKRFALQSFRTIFLYNVRTVAQVIQNVICRLIVESHNVIVYIFFTTII